jgi:hypothetical protein
MLKLNWRRGIFRIWAVISALRLLAVAAPSLKSLPNAETMANLRARLWLYKHPQQETPNRPRRAKTQKR